MAKNKSPKNNAPASKRKLPVLSSLYILLALSVAGAVVYGYYNQMGRHSDDPTADSAEIAPPTKPGDHGEGHEADHAKPHADDHAPEDKGHGTAHDTPAQNDHGTAASHEQPSHDEKPHEVAPHDAPTHETETHAAPAHEAPAEETTSHSTPEHKTDAHAEPAHEAPKHEEEKPAPDHHEPEKATDHGAATTEEPKHEAPAHPVEPTPEKAPHGDTGHDAPKTDHAPAPTQHQEEPVKPHAAKEAETHEEPAKTSPKKPEPVQETAKEGPPPLEVGPLPPVPDPALTAKSDYGLLPIIGPDGRLPWRVYARPFDDPLARPRIAIIISDMGMSQFATRSAIQNLPGEITLSFNPYGRDLQNWVSQARAAGHEALLQLPMEPFGYPENDPGPQSLLSRLTDKENLTRLEWMLGRFTGYAGVTNQMGSKFTTSRDDITPVLDVVKQRGLMFLDGRTSGRSLAGFVAKEKFIPVAINNRFIDNKADRASIDQRLFELEKIARVTGVAIGIGYPYPVTLERVANWSKTLNRKGLVLSPVSAVANRQEIQ